MDLVSCIVVAFIWREAGRVVMFGVKESKGYIGVWSNGVHLS